APVLATYVAVVLSIVAIVRRDRTLRTAALIAGVVAGVSALPTFASGYFSAPTVRAIHGIDSDAVDTHLWWAIAAMSAAVVSGVAAAGALVLRRAGEDDHRAITLAFALVVVAAVAMTVAGNKGGVIRHPDIAWANSDGGHHEVAVSAIRAGSA